MRIAIISMIITALVLMAAVLVSVGWVASRQILLEAATRTARDAGTITSERSRRMLEPGAATLRILSFDPVVSAEQREPRLARMKAFAAELAANPLVSAIYAGYSNGDFILMRALDRREIRRQFNSPPGANYLVQLISSDSSGARHGEYIFYDAENRIVEQRDMPEYRFDPRTRPWYLAARDTVSTVTSPPYVFFTTRQVGVSLSRLASNNQTIIGLDMALDDLAEGLGNLKITPGAQLALIDKQQRVLAYQDMSAVIKPVAGSDMVGFARLSELGVPPLARLAQVASGDQAVSYQAGGREWLGVMQPFDAIEGAELQLLIAAPADELLFDLERSRNSLILLAAAVVLLFLPVDWWAGNGLGKALERVTTLARRMSRFDFSRTEHASSGVREVQVLTEAINNVSLTVEAFLSISQVLGSERQTEKMLQQVLEKLVSAARCQGGAVYLWQKESDTMLRAAAVGDQGELRPQFPYPQQRQVRQQGRATASGSQQVEFELKGRSGQLEGVLVLLHETDRAHSSPAFQAFTSQLGGMLAIAIETRQLIESQKALFDAVIRVLADAIDAKSPYTGGHCERVPALAIMLADDLARQQSGPYADFRLNEDDRYAFYLAAWLHDCGKITSAEHIVDKATKLEVIYNRIHEVRMRFEVLWRDAELACLQAQLDGDDAAMARARRDSRQQQLQEDFRFVASCNIGGEQLSDAAIARLQAIAGEHWLRHFDDTLGLSTEELRRQGEARPQAPPLPASEPLLADRPEHLVPWGTRKPAVEHDDPRNHLGFDMKLPAQRQNMGELHNLAIRRGTLTEEDRFAINDHIVQTLLMLKQLPWPRQLARVPDIAANHHERLDGKGYPRRLTADALQTTDRIMAIADIFEALTAADRPYKPAKTLSESLRIMVGMCRDGHIDGELFGHFLQSGLWRDYAQRFMLAGQQDTVDVDALLTQLRQP